MAGRGDRVATAGCVKILIDMNLSPTWVPFLSQNGFLAMHWSAVGAASAKDAEIMAYAAANDFVVFTHDLDFGTLLASSKASGPSVVQIRAQDLLPEAVGPLVLKSLREVHLHLETGALVTIEPSRHRIRILPV
jgi:predicted nuclease of predicted toxin-antitoxin system